MTLHGLQNKKLLKPNKSGSLPFIDSKDAASNSFAASTVIDFTPVLFKQLTNLLSYLPPSAAPPTQGALMTMTSFMALSYNAF
jgi:hypothetical protein